MNAVDQIDQPTIVDGHVVRGGTVRACRRVRHERADFPGRERVRDIEDAQPLSEDRTHAFDGFGIVQEPCVTTDLTEFRDPAIVSRFAGSIARFGEYVSRTQMYSSAE